MVLRRCVGAMAFICMWAASQTVPPGTRNGEWSSYAGDLRNFHYSPLDQINANNFNEAVTAGFGGPQPRNAALWGNLVHSEDMWGQTAVYIRIKNMVPVASQGRGGGKGKGGGKGAPPAAPQAK